MTKVLWFDCETTGIDPKQNDILKLAAIIEIDGEIVDRECFYMQPFNYESITVGALEVNKLTLDEIRKFPMPVETWTKITKLFSKHIDKYNKADKFYPAGYNVRFDLDFLAEFFRKCHDMYFGSYCNWRCLDPMILLNILSYQGKINLPNLKLETVCEYFKIELKAHDAISDIEATRQLFNLLMTKYFGS